MKFLTIFILLLGSALYAQDSKETAPEFKGGKESLKAYITDNFEYPLYESKEGTVLVEFTLGTYGYVYDVKIIKGLSESIDESVYDLVYDMPSWNSARDKNGIRIETSITLPIKVEKPENLKKLTATVQPFAFQSEADFGEKIYDVTEISPSYSGGEEAMFDFISTNFNYPERARELGEQGTAFVQFVVTKNGNIIGIKVMKSASESIDREAMRVISIMPNWIPGKQAGKAMNVRYILPIKATIH